MATRPRVFTIPASAPFVPALVRALLDGRLVEGFAPAHDPLALADATLYLPTRRACRLVRDSFLDVTGGSAAILPRIVAIGDVDEDEIAFAQAASGAALDLPDAIGGLERRLLLTELVLKWATAITADETGHAPLIASTPAAAIALADDLARLMDDMTTRQVSWDRLDELVPEALDDYWQLTLRFLKIAREAWPEILRERGAIEPAARRDALITAEAARLAAKTDGPVIAAGSTGSMPATAGLLATIATLPHGAVVLPGLDTDLDDRSWALIAGSEADTVAPAVGHPQFAMEALLRRIGIARDAVEVLVPAAPYGRERLVSEAFRPAAATELWRARTAEDAFAAQADAALATMAVIEAANPEEEALAIAVALREAVEDADATAALITPDRALARRVLAALGRWNVMVDDSGGDALAETPAGTFARLAAEAALGGLAPVTLLALLKHPRLRLGRADGAHARAIAALERAILRGPRPKPGTAGLADALEAFRGELAKYRRKERSDLHGSDPRTTLGEDELAAAETLIVELTAALAPLEALRAGAHGLADLAARHRQVIDLLSRDDTGAPAALAGSDGTRLAEALDEIAASPPAGALSVTLADYPELFHALIGDRVVRRPGLPGVRVRILGPLEARLTTATRVVLGGLNEGTWPPEARSDAWLSRPMRLALGLDLPERRIALSAHDFAQLLGAQEVILSRAAKAAGAPTVASRFVQRLAAVAGERWGAALARGGHYLAWARTLDEPREVKRAPRPAPRPPREARPTALSVTDIEHWLRDPYTIWARYILRLPELDPVDLMPGAADRGIVIHGALGEFTETYAQALPDDPLIQLLRLGRKHFAALDDYPEARAFWWPRFRRIARWFAAWERERRGNVAQIHAEVSGRLPIPVGERTFTLRGRADRIERLADGRYAILDYKTGTPPSEKQVRIGLAPQLTLEAAMLRRGAFQNIPAADSIAELMYVGIKGGAPPGNANAVEFKDSTPDGAAERALAKLTEVVTRFESEEQPYLPLVMPMWKSRYGPYDHLARIKEWLAAGDEAEDAE